MAKRNRSTDDDQLVWELLLGCRIRNADGRVVRITYLKPGSKRERDAKAALVRLLKSDRELSSGFRSALSTFFDADHPYETRELVFKNRKRGIQPNRYLEMSIAEDIALKVMSGVQIESAVQSAVKNFGLNRSTVFRAWEKHRHFWEG
jgi:hypothetical protein